MERAFVILKQNGPTAFDRMQTCAAGQLAEFPASPVLPSYTSSAQLAGVSFRRVQPDVCC